jgi:hypothetical protein
VCDTRLVVTTKKPKTKVLPTTRRATYLETCRRSPVPRLLAERRGSTQIANRSLKAFLVATVHQSRVAATPSLARTNQSTIIKKKPPSTHSLAKGKNALSVEIVGAGRSYQAHTYRSSWDVTLAYVSGSLFRSAG